MVGRHVDQNNRSLSVERCVHANHIISHHVIIIWDRVEWWNYFGQQSLQRIFPVTHEQRPTSLFWAIRFWLNAFSSHTVCTYVVRAHTGPRHKLYFFKLRSIYPPHEYTQNAHRIDAIISLCLVVNLLTQLSDYFRAFIRLRAVTHLVSTYLPSRLAKSCLNHLSTN